LLVLLVGLPLFHWVAFWHHLSKPLRPGVAGFHKEQRITWEWQVAQSVCYHASSRSAASTRWLYRTPQLSVPRTKARWVRSQRQLPVDILQLSHSRTHSTRITPMNHYLCWHCYI